MSGGAAGPPPEGRRWQERVQATEPTSREWESTAQQEEDAHAGEAESGLQLRERAVEIAAHELRARAMALQVAVEELLQLLSPPEKGRAAYRRAARTVAVQSEALRRSVASVLDARRVRTGTLHLQRQRTNVAALVRRVVSRWTTAVPPSRRQRIAIQAPRLLWASVDPGQLELVLTNLLDNARKYAPAGGEVQIVLEQPSAGLLRLEVRDQGSGLAPEHLPQLFEPYYQAHSAGEGPAGGLGLGLFICREIVVAHGGQIAATVPEGGGFCITLTLPALAISAPGSGKPAA